MYSKQHIWVQICVNSHIIQSILVVLLVFNLCESLIVYIFFIKWLLFLVGDFYLLFIGDDSLHTLPAPPSKWLYFTHIHV